MKSSSRIRFVSAWFVASAAVVFIALLIAGTLLDVRLGGGALLVILLTALVSALALAGLSLLVARLFLDIGTINKENARKLADDLAPAGEGDLSRPWEDIELSLNGDAKVIPFSDAYELLVGVLAEADRMSSRLNNLAHEIMDQAVKLTEGAEDQSASVKDSTDSISKIDLSIRKVLTNVEDLSELGDNVSSSTYEMLSSVEEVNESAQNLSQAVEEEVSAIEQIVGNIHSVAESTDSLSGAADQSRQSMENIEKATRSIQERAEDSAKLSEAAREGASSSKEFLAKTVEGIHQLSETVESTRQVMHTLGVQSRSIGEILNVITSVAADTHLLSLNASIMAAKAGEHGRGFSVVAQEIKTLANRTSESAKEIENLILDTQESVDTAIQSIEDGTTMVGEGMRLSEQADQSLKDVLQKAEIAAQNSRKIAGETEDQASMSQQVFKAVEEVAKRTELIRAAMREQEDSSGYVRERVFRTQELVNQVAQAMAEQSESSRRISRAIEGLTSRIQSIRLATEDQAKSSEGVVHAIDTIRKMADLVAISSQNVSNTSMSVLHQSLLLRHELKGIKLPERKFPVTMGLLFDNLREERWKRERGIFETRAKELGANLEFRVAEGDHELQAKQADELIGLGVDIMIIVAVDAEKAAGVVEKAKAADIPAIAYDRLIKNTRIDLFVSFNARTIGAVQAETALKEAEGKSILVLAGSPTDVNSHILNKGQMKVLKPKAENKEIEIVDEIWVPDWSPEQAYKLTREVIGKKGPIDAVVASNDGTAGGAIKAVAELLPDKKVVVTGMDTELAACRRIVEGSQTMTMYMPIKLQASRAMEAALLMLRKEEIPGITDYVDNDAYKVPAILLKPIKVDAENMEEVVVKDGFHAKEDIYQGTPDRRTGAQS